MIYFEEKNNSKKITAKSKNKALYKFNRLFLAKSKAKPNIKAKNTDCLKAFFKYVPEYSTEPKIRRDK
jgi:hypothetical protein